MTRFKKNYTARRYWLMVVNAQKDPSIPVYMRDAVDRATAKILGLILSGFIPPTIADFLQEIQSQQGAERAVSIMAMSRWMTTLDSRQSA